MYNNYMFCVKIVSTSAVHILVSKC